MGTASVEGLVSVGTAVHWQWVGWPTGPGFLPEPAGPSCAGAGQSCPGPPPLSLLLSLLPGGRVFRHLLPCPGAHLV